LSEAIYLFAENGFDWILEVYPLLQRINQAPYTFAGIYNRDWESLLPNFQEDFDLFYFSHFYQSVRENDQGDILLTSSRYERVQIHYQWIFTDAPESEQILLLIGVSNEDMGIWAKWGSVIILILVTTLLNLILVRMILHYSQQIERVELEK